MNLEKKSARQNEATNIAERSLQQPFHHVLKSSQEPIVIKEDTTNFCRFNVMPGKFVEETLFIKEYRIQGNSIEAIYDRQYHSDMARSPDHLIYLTFISHAQKMLYIYLCQHFGFTYEPYGAEKLKFWATKVSTELPKLIRETRDVKQTLEVQSLKELKPNQYHVEVIVKANDVISSRVEGMVYLIEEENKLKLIAGVSATSFLSAYYKVKANNPEYWKTIGINGTPTRQKALYQDSYMQLFANLGSTEAFDKVAAINPNFALTAAVRHKHINKFMSAVAKKPANPIKQVVILGAGMDTRPLRKSKYEGRLKFFEVDQAKLLQFKLAVYQQNSIEPKSALVGADYLKDNFIELLAQSGLNLAIPTLFIWEGNVAYLPLPAIKSVLAKIKASFQQDTYIIFDYPNNLVASQYKQDARMKGILDMLTKDNAPMLSTINDIQQLTSELDAKLLENKSLYELIKFYGVGDKPDELAKGISICKLQLAGAEAKADNSVTEVQQPIRSRL